MELIYPLDFKPPTRIHITYAEYNKISQQKRIVEDILMACGVKEGEFEMILDHGTTTSRYVFNGRGMWERPEKYKSITPQLSVFPRDLTNPKAVLPFADEGNYDKTTGYKLHSREKRTGHDYMGRF